MAGGYLEVMSLNPSRVELGMLSTSVLSRAHLNQRYLMIALAVASQHNLRVIGWWWLGVSNDSSYCNKSLQSSCYRTVEVYNRGDECG